MFTLPTELLTVLLSGAREPHGTLVEPCMFGESSIILVILPLRGGIIIFCVMTGEESGELCSARVEWCRLVHAREKSNPRECLGSDVAGLADNGCWPCCM